MGLRASLALGFGAVPCRDFGVGTHIAVGFGLQWGLPLSLDSLIFRLTELALLRASMQCSAEMEKASFPALPSHPQI